MCVLSQSAHSNDAIDKAQKLFTQAVAAESVPGISVAVGDINGMIWAQGFGFSNIENQQPMTVQTKLRVGSVAKVITAAGVMRLHQQNNLDLDGNINQQVPEWPAIHPNISLRQLANHTSGIRHYKGQEFLSNKQYNSTVEALAIFSNDELLFKPGSRYKYSTYAWTLISAAMEKADQKRNFKEIITDEVFKPLGLSETTFDDSVPLISHRHSPYSYRNSQLFNSPAVNSSYKYAGGGFLSTPSDVVKFSLAHLKPGYLNEQSLNSLFATTAKDKGSNFGIGWMVGFDSYQPRFNGQNKRDKDFKRIMKEHKDSVMHSGGSMGGTTMMILCREHQHAVTVVKNVSGEISANVFELALKTLDIFN